MKVIVSIIILVLIIVIGGVIFWTRVPDILSNRLSDMMKVKVSISSIGLGWNKIDVKRVEIGNPPRSILAKAFACSAVNVSAPLPNYIKKNIVINEIAVKDIYLGLEFDSATSTNGNWTTIIGNMESSETKEVQKEPKKEQSSESERTVLIHRLVLTNINVDVVYRKQGGKVISLPMIPIIELTEISSQGGVPMDQIMQSVLGSMLKEVFIKQNLKNMLQDLINPPSQLKPFFNPLKKLFSFIEEEVEEEVAQ